MLGHLVRTLRKRNTVKVPKYSPFHSLNTFKSFNKKEKSGKFSNYLCRSWYVTCVTNYLHYVDSITHCQRHGPLLVFTCVVVTRYLNVCNLNNILLIMLFTKIARWN